GTVVSGGGFEVVFNGGIASGTTVSSGGTLVILPGAQVSGTVPLAGSHIISANVLVLSSNAVVSAVSGTVSGDVIAQGETEYVLAGGIAVSSVVPHVGTAKVHCG